jgi:hypothetical protein
LLTAEARRLLERFKPDRPQAVRFDWSELSLEFIQALRFRATYAHALVPARYTLRNAVVQIFR